MRSSLEFVKFDEEDKGGIATSARGFYPYGVQVQEKDHTFYLCYYELRGKTKINIEGEETEKRFNENFSRIFRFNYLRI